MREGDKGQRVALSGGPWGEWALDCAQCRPTLVVTGHYPGHKSTNPCQFGVMKMHKWSAQRPITSIHPQSCSVRSQKAPHRNNLVRHVWNSYVAQAFIQ